MFPGYVDMLTKNSYVSINASYTLAREDRGKDKGRPRHRNDTLKYLCACYCDIDIYKAKLTFNQAYAKIMEMCETGEIPWASMVVNSGKGMWLLWFLHDFNNPDQAHCGAWDKSEYDALAVYAKINKAMIEKLKHIGADPQCHSGDRYIRVPGSFRTDEEKAVWWSVQGSGESGFSYTLWDLATRMEVQIRKLLPQEAAAIHPRKKMSGRKKGQLAANSNRLCVMKTLIGLRGGGFVKGYRGRGAWIYAMCLHKCGVPLPDAKKAVQDYGNSCTPPFSKAECDGQTRSGYRGGRWGYRKIASTFNVTLEESQFISQRIGKPFPCADGGVTELVRRDGKPKQADTIALRRQEILSITNKTGKVPPLRTMETMLQERGFESTGYVTIRSDYKALNLESPRSTRLREGAVNRHAQGILLPTA